MPLLGNIVTGGLRMSKYISKSARKRIPMTSKMGNKNFYKGKGSTKEGRLNSKAEAVRIEGGVEAKTGWTISAGLGIV
eukprot:g8689.t2